MLTTSARLVLVCPGDRRFDCAVAPRRLARRVTLGSGSSRRSEPAPISTDGISPFPVERASSARTTSHVRTRRTIPALSSTSHRAPSTAVRASTRRRGAQRSRCTASTRSQTWAAPYRRRLVPIPNCLTARARLRQAARERQAVREPVSAEHEPRHAFAWLRLEYVLRSLPGYAGRSPGLYAKFGDQFFTSPWAGPADTRLKPEASRKWRRGVHRGKELDVRGKPVTIQFENRNEFDVSAIRYTSYPAGATPGCPQTPTCPAALHPNQRILR